MLRLFTAVPIPWDVAQTLKRRQTGLPGARWRPEEALHVTLAFYGEMSERQADDLAGELARIPVEPFEIVLKASAPGATPIVPTPCGPGSNRASG